MKTELRDIKERISKNYKDEFHKLANSSDQELIDIIKPLLTTRTRAVVGIVSYYNQYKKLSTSQRITLMEWATDKIIKRYHNEELQNNIKLKKV